MFLANSVVRSSQGQYEYIYICVSSLGKSDNSGEADDLSSASLPYRKLFYLKNLKCVCLCVRDLGAY